jgi:hypothetical protein
MFPDAPPHGKPASLLADEAKSAPELDYPFMGKTIIAQLSAFMY